MVHDHCAVVFVVDKMVRGCQCGASRIRMAASVGQGVRKEKRQARISKAGRAIREPMSV